MDLGRENLSDMGRNTREGPRGFHLVSPRAREIEAGERKSEEPQAKDGNNFNKTSNEKEQANCGKQMKRRVRHLI